MALLPGSRLEHYEIIGAIGAGGMGEVYRARDTKLGREVAFKILPDAFAGDPERLARFQREAQLLASLNHPNIAQIYGVVEAPGARGIVMEFVDGETLQTRLNRGALAIDEILAISKQIAEALEAAHDRDIVHRDLKPANIMLSAEGKVKVLDFGLAKAMEPSSGAANLSNSPTILSATQAHQQVLIGTPAYMSPEQARGHVADERSDVWAFGCVLYEMLTGRQAFTGDTITDLIGGIVRVDPEWNALALVPAHIQAIVKRCLQKDRRLRYHAIGDVRIDLEAPVPAAASAVAGTASRRREWIAWAVAAAVAAVALGAQVRRSYFAPKASLPVQARFLYELPAGASLPPAPFAPSPVVSPDGRHLAFMAGGTTSIRLWIRPIDGLTAQPLAATANVNIGPYPFWSHDSRFVAFVSNGKLKKAAIDGGPAVTLCDAVTSRYSSGGTWNQDDVIVFAHRDSLHRVNAAGGVSTAVRTPDKSKGELGYSHPHFLPDGKHFLYLAVNTDAGRTEVRVGSLDSSEDKPLFHAYSRLQYAPTGHILFVRDGSLMAQPFDASSLSLSGDVFPVTERIGIDPVSGIAAFSASTNGTLVYRTTTASANTELTWVDRAGKRLDSVRATGNFQRPRLSVDENRVVVEKVGDGALRDVWILDLARGTSSRFTFDTGDDTYPTFSDDGKQVAFVSSRGEGLGLYVKPATGVGTEQLLLKLEGQDPAASDFSPDGKIILYNFVSTDSGRDIWAVPLTGEKKPYPVLNQKYNEHRESLSPDGRWLLYTSNESGRNEIYVQTFPPSGGKWQVSVDGGNYAYWRRDGKEILFDTPDAKMMAVDVKLSATFEAGVPQHLFDIPGIIIGGRFAFTTDAKRFLLALTAQSGDRPTITAVLNWNPGK